MPKLPKVEALPKDIPDIDIRPIIQALERQRGSTIDNLNDDDRFWMKTVAKVHGINANTVTIGGFAWAIQKTKEGDLKQNAITQLDDLYKKIVPIIGNESLAA